MNKDTVIQLVTRAGYKVIENKRMKTNYGDTLRLSNGTIVNIYNSGKVHCQGKNPDEINALLNGGGVSSAPNGKVFVVYGHDKVARIELEAMLRRWDLEPLIFDQLESSGNTVIEKLEEYIPKAGFCIVLATPDDMGYPKEHEEAKKYRVRQNVVLEMGMFLAALGRSKVAILLKNIEEMEKPSDIHGLIYIPFSHSVEDTKVSLAKELNNNGYHIDISKL